jgi:hypothetical protein
VPHFSRLLREVGILIVWDGTLLSVAFDFDLTLIVWSGHSCPLAFDFDLDIDWERHGLQPCRKASPKMNSASAAEGSGLPLRRALSAHVVDQIYDDRDIERQHRDFNPAKMPVDLIKFNRYQ